MQKGSVAFICILLLCSFTAPCESAFVRKYEESHLQAEEDHGESERESIELMQAAKKMQAFCLAFANGGVNGTDDKPGRGQTGIASDQIADPTCIRGVVSPDFKVCCAKECGSCGDHKLCDNPGKYNELTGKLVDECCYSRVKKAAPSCDKDHPPCVLAPEYKETLKKWKQDLPARHAMQDCNKAIPKARLSHDDAIEKGEFLAHLYLNGETKYKDAKRIAEDVRHKCDEKIADGNEKASEAAAKIAGATAGDKVVNPMTGESPYMDWEQDEASGKSEAMFYKQIKDNAIIIVDGADIGLKQVASLRAEAQKVQDVTPLQKKLDHLIVDAEHWYQEALKLWQQWKDSTKDYDCGAPPPVANAESVCASGNTKYSPDCPIKCAAGYDGNGTKNHLWCEKVGKFGQELSGEWTGMATCAGMLCGLPPVVKHSRTVMVAIRYPDVAAYLCLEGFQTPWDASDFTIACNTKGFFDTNSSHVCNPVHCGTAPVLPGTYPVEGDFIYAQEANYSCLEGYTLSGLAGGRTYFHTSCQATGKFTHGNMGCQPVRCGPVPLLVNAKITSQTSDSIENQHYGDEASYECLPGYTLDQAATGPTTFTLSCMADGEFAVLGSEGDSPMSQPKCKPICVGPPAAVAHGMMAMIDMCYGDVVEVTAEDGYSMTGHAKEGLIFDISVSSQGTFEGVEQFQPVQCGFPPKAGNATTSFKTDAVYQDVVEYQCTNGYSTDTTNDKGAKSFTLICQEDGTFTPLPPHKGCVMINNCMGHTCGAHGTCVNNLLNYTCKCQSGYGMTYHKKAQQLICGNIDDCGPEACGVGNCIDGLNSYSCDCPEGYKQVNMPAPGGGAIEQHTCAAVSCGTPPEVTDGLVVPMDDQFSKAMYSETVSYVCDPGYTTDGHVGGAQAFTITCQASKKFTEISECKPITCGEVPTVKNAGASATTATYNETVSFECATGYSLDGTAGGEKSFEVTCGLTGEFSDPMECKRVTCGSAPDLAHSQHPAETLYFQETVEYSCFSGYTTDGSKDGPTTFSASCKEDGNFTKLGQCLPKVCGEFTPDTFKWAYFTDEGKISFPSVTEITCLDGFTIDGHPAGNKSFIVSCLASGDFEAYDAGMCKPVVCGMPPKVGNTTVTEIIGGEVSSGGTPETPGKVIMTSDPDESPCTKCYNDLHDGICVTNPDYDNHCTSWYGGGANNYCQNGGPDGAFPITKCTPPPEHTTIVFGDHAVYKCAVGFTVGGELNAPDTYKVACKANGFFSHPTPDMMCKNVNDCEGHTCGPKGTCVDLIGPAPAYTCDCEYGYIIKVSDNGEKHCGQKDDCKGQDCGVGVCKDLIGSYTCTCPGGYYVGLTADGKKTCLPVVCSESTPIVEHASSRQSGSFMQVAHSMRTGPVVFPTTIIYTCDEGYSVDASPVEGRSKFQAQCKADGQLHGLATCQKVTCGTPPVHEHTKLIAPDTDHNSVDFEEEAKYECDSGYTLNAIPLAAEGETFFTQKCQADGLLSAAKVCEPVVCGNSPILVNSKSSIGGTIHFGQTLTYECNVGYTLDGSSDGLNEFTVPCLEDGSFQLPDSTCSPVAVTIPEVSNAELFKYAGSLVSEMDTAPTAATYPDTFTYKCKSGYTLNGKASGATKFSTAINSEAILTPLLPSGCLAITYSIRAITRNAPDASYLDGVTVKIKNTDFTATSSNGHFSFPGVAAGSYTFTYHANGFIDGEKMINITKDIATGGAADISMSPVLAANAWRVILKWGVAPRDLDTYGTYGSYKACWYQKTQQGNGMRIRLEHDDTNSYGPETLHIEDVGSCTGGASFCDIKYAVNDYTETGIMGQTDVEITLYNADRIAGTWKIADCQSTVSSNEFWWDVFILDGMTNELKWNCNQGPIPVPTTTTTTPYSGVYIVQNVLNGFYLNVAHNSMSKGANIWLWDNYWHSSTQWRISGTQHSYVFTSILSGMVLNVQGSSMNTGGNIQVWNNPTSHSSNWIIEPATTDGAITIANENSNMVLNDKGNSMSEGANVQQWNNPGSTSSQWYLTELPRFNGVYEIESVNAPGEYLNVAGNSMDIGANIQVWDNPTVTSTQWKISGEQGKYNLINVNSGMVMNVASSSQDNGANIHQWDNPTSRSSQFTITKAPTSGAYLIANVNSGKMVNCEGNAQNKGTNVQQWDNPTQPATQWFIKPAQEAVPPPPNNDCQCYHCGSNDEFNSADVCGVASDACSSSSPDNSGCWGTANSANSGCVCSTKKLIQPCQCYHCGGSEEYNNADVCGPASDVCSSSSPDNGGCWNNVDGATCQCDSKSTTG